ncbi:hypothetical protein VSQ78_24865 [Nocardiopsis alba]|uniref:Uncharacterized protein n=1 Tax=Nocardiopsis alba TaxID=53437 RepID=A0ABV5E278_9ACTN
MTPTDTINGLSLLITDLLTDLVADGRMTEAEAAKWEREAAAIVTAGASE